MNGVKLPSLVVRSLVHYLATVRDEVILHQLSAGRRTTVAARVANCSAIV